MASENLLRLSLMSYEGTYELQTEGFIYRVSIPPFYRDPAFVTLESSRGEQVASASPRFRIFGLLAVVGEPAELMIKQGEDYRQVKTKKVTRILRVEEA